MPQYLLNRSEKCTKIQTDNSMSSTVGTELPLFFWGGGISLSFYYYFLNIFGQAFSQELKCSSKESTLSQYIYLPKSTDLVQVQCMGSDVR